MTEPEILEDELFADLYNDDEPKAAASPPAPDPFDPANSGDPSADIGKAADHDHQPQVRSEHAPSGQQLVASADYDIEEEDDDDEVDFNLGGGTALVSVKGHDGTPNSYNINTPQQASALAVPPPARTASSKEDG